VKTDRLPPLDPTSVRKAAEFVEAINAVCEQFGARICARYAVEHPVPFMIDGTGQPPRGFPWHMAHIGDDPTLGLVIE
jgi:hypothetical protein